VQEPVLYTTTKRRDYFKTGALAASLFPMVGKASEDAGNPEERVADNWYQVGKGQRGLPDRKETLRFDVAMLAGVHPDKVKALYKKLFIWEQTLERPLFLLRRQEEGWSAERFDQFRKPPSEAY